MNQADDAARTGKLVFRITAESEEALAKLRRRLALDFSDVETAGEIERVPGGDGSAGLGVRQWIGTQMPIFLHELTEIMHFSERLGASYSRPGQEVRSIEPGYVTETKAVMGRRDDDPVRIYLGPGVYAEPVARLADGVAQASPWPSGDDLGATALGFFGQVRERLTAQPGSTAEPAA